MSRISVKSLQPSNSSNTPSTGTRNKWLNLPTPTVYDHADRADRAVVNGPATEVARDKQEKLKERFKQWVYAHARQGSPPERTIKNGHP